MAFRLVASKPKINARGIAVPAVHVRLRELVSPQHAAKAAAQANRQGLIGLCRRRPFVRRPIAGPVDQAQDFARVGQGQHQHVIAPGAVVGDVHALLALAGGFDQHAVHVQNRLLEEGSGWPAQTFRRVSLIMSSSV